ncbi:MAG: hypothetical protein WBV92_03735, partial [Nitrosotalea sp.]
KEYLKIIEKIYIKYKKHGFRDLQYVLERYRLPLHLKQMRQEFITNAKWKKEWVYSEQILKENKLEKTLIQQRIFHDLFRQVEIHTGNWIGDRILYLICLD